MTRRAKHVEPLPSTCQHSLVDREWEIITRVVIDLARVEIRIRAQVSARNRAFHERARRALVRKKIISRERVEAGLHVHIETTGRGRHYDQYDARQQCAQVRHDVNLAPPKAIADETLRGIAVCQRRHTWHPKQR